MSTYEPLLHLLTFFYIYAFLGWGVEIAYHALKTGHLVNRGMLAGPVCPIYGAGMLMLAMVLEAIGIPVSYIGLIVAVDRLFDMGRTCLNVTGDIACSLCVSRWAGKKA